jgi:hypothetical protein
VYQPQKRFGAANGVGEARFAALILSASPSVPRAYSAWRSKPAAEYAYVPKLQLRRDALQRRIALSVLARVAGEEPPPSSRPGAR